MSDYPKYRLKKDIPNYEAGSVFIVRTDNILLSGKDEIEDLNGNFYDKVANIKHFDEWFEEVKEPTWVRKQIKEVHGKNIYINYRVVKAFYLPVGEWTSEHKTAFRMEPGDVAGFAEYDEDVKGYINQMVELGYIEIEDNPNIVWEDEND